MTFNIVMGEYLGRARFNRLTGKGSPALYGVLAVLIHTLYDACTVFNSKRMTGEMSGVLIALSGYAGLMVYEIAVLIRFRKNTEKLCGLHISAAESAA